MLNLLLPSPKITGGLVPSYFYPPSFFLLGVFGFFVAGFLYRRIVLCKQPYYFHRGVLGGIRLAYAVTPIFIFYILGSRIWTPSLYFPRYFSFALYCAIFIFGAIFLLPGKKQFWIGKEKELERLSRALIRWGFSIGIISLIFFLVRTLPIVPELLVPPALIDRQSQGGISGWCLKIILVMLEWLKFSGPNVDRFNRYLADPLYVYFLFANAYVLYQYIRPDPERDKYWHFMRSWFSLFTFGRSESERRLYWSSQSKVALLAILVKVFFGPLMFTWAVGGLEHQRYLIETFEWRYEQLLSFLISLFLFIDVTIFAFGYFVELPQLKNEIKSVESTLLGWTVCLMCYPPFSFFSFQPFDVPLFRDYQPLGSTVQTIVQGILPLLWLNYVWATIALGVRSSNLTNRGIVARGPYAYIRHPAYASKVLIWVLEAIAFADRTFFRSISLVIVYWLRAWTEERHLTQDPDYLEYKKNVRWMFIPGVI